MCVANPPIDEEGTVEFDMILLKNGIPLTLSVTNKADSEGGRTYFSGLSWIQIATK